MQQNLLIAISSQYLLVCTMSVLKRMCICFCFFPPPPSILYTPTLILAIKTILSIIIIRDFRSYNYETDGLKHKHFTLDFTKRMNIEIISIILKS